MGYAVDCPAYKDLVAKNPDSPEYKNISEEYKVCVCVLMYRMCILVVAVGVYRSSPFFTLNLLCFHLPLFMYLCPLPFLAVLSILPSLPFPRLSSRLLSTLPLLFFRSPPLLHLLLRYLHVPLTSPFRTCLCSCRTGLERPKSTCQMCGRLLMWSTCSLSTTFLPTWNGPRQKCVRSWLTSPSMT